MSTQYPLIFGSRQPLRAEDWVAHVGVADAMAAVQAWPAWPGGALCLVGPAGSGKSHLARLWAQRVGAVSPHLEGACLPESRVPLLLEDADQRRGDETLFHLVDQAAKPGAGLLLTARTPPRLWPVEVPDLRSRLNALAVAELAEPDDEGLSRLLERGFRARHVRPAPGLLTYLLRRVERSAAAAMEIAERLDQAALAAGKPVSRSFARELLGDQADLFEDEEPGPLSHA